MGARVVLTARSAERGRSAVAEITSRLGGDARIQLVVFDLSDLSSVRRGAAEILEQAPTLDVLVNNAGVVLSARSETVDGFETTFATNHLGPFLLTNLLLDRLRASAPSRVVTVSSAVHTRVRRGLRFDDLQSERRYRGAQVYAETKLANILFTSELARRLDGTGVTANALHPGAVRSGYGQDGDTRGLISVALTAAAPLLHHSRRGGAHVRLSGLVTRGRRSHRPVLRQVRSSTTVGECPGPRGSPASVER